jgi:hypothetical protein
LERAFEKLSVRAIWPFDHSSASDRAMRGRMLAVSV